MNKVHPSKTSTEKISLPHQQFDIVTKDVIYTFPEDVLRFIMNRTDIQFLEHLETEFANVETHEMDSLIKVLLNGEPALVHCEFQTSDSTNLDMARRNVGYIGRCYERYGLPIFSHVIYLRPNAGQNDPGGVKQNIEGYNFIVEYKVIRLIEVDGQSVLELRQPGLMPFLPLMPPPTNVDALQWLHQCVETTKTLSLDTPTRANLLVDMWIMSGLVHDRLPLSEVFLEDFMQESPVYQSILEKGIAQGIERGKAQGIEQGERKKAIENILELIDIRFQVRPTETMNSAIEDITDLSRLSELHRAAAQVESLEAFEHLLENNGKSD